MIMIKGIYMFGIVKAVYKKNRSIILHTYPWSFIISRITDSIFAILFPLLIYSFVFEHEVSAEFISYVGTTDYISYIVTGQALDILSFATLMNVGRCLITEIREGTLEPFLNSSASRIQYFVGAYLEQFTRSFMEYIIIFLFGFVLGMHVDLSKIVLCSVIVILSSLAFFSVSIALSTVMVYTRDTYLVQNTLMLFMKCVCGVVFPIQYLPYPLRVISNLFPLTPALKLFRECVLLNTPFQECFLQVIHIAVLSVIYFTLGYIGFRHMENQLIEEVLS